MLCCAEDEWKHLKPLSCHSASLRIKYPHGCLTGKQGTARIVLQLLLLVIKQPGLKTHRPLPPPSPALASTLCRLSSPAPCWKRRARTSNLPLATDFRETWIFAVYALNEPGWNWATGWGVDSFIGNTQTFGDWGGGKKKGKLVEGNLNQPSVAPPGAQRAAVI